MKKIGIAFGAGGARGIAQILIVEALEEFGLKPSIISGSSIGAVVGAFLLQDLLRKKCELFLMS
jgi:NTE family protein